jgi:hypothetical protein
MPTEPLGVREARQDKYSTNSYPSWQRVTRKRNPLPGSPVFDLLVKPLEHSQAVRP